MKILFLARRFYPDTGGVEKHVYEISRRLIEKGNHVTVVTQSQGSKNELDGIEIIRLPKIPINSSEKLFIWKWFWKNRNLIKEAEVIHSHDVFFWYLPFKFIFLSKKCFITFHGYESYPITKKAIVIRKISEFLSNGNIIVGDFIKKWYHASPTYVIYGGVDIPKKNNKSKKKFSSLFFGRLDEQTGILDYAKAADIVRRKYPKFVFKIIGEGKFLNKLSRFHPIPYKNNINDYLNEYNFAFVSRYLSILEAFAAKRLVFAVYDNPVKEDYLRMSPFSNFIIIENNPDELAKKVIYYFENKREAEDLINSSYDWVKKQTWREVVSTYLKLWANK